VVSRLHGFVRLLNLAASARRWWLIGPVPLSNPQQGASPNKGAAGGGGGGGGGGLVNELVLSGALAAVVYESWVRAHAPCSQTSTERAHTAACQPLALS
jgi:hypothetical protein